MKRPPFKILGSKSGSFRRNGKFVVGGRLSWAWENLVMSIACGFDAVHEIRRNNGPWYVIEMTVEEAEQTLNPCNDAFGRRRVARARAFRNRKKEENA